MRFRTVLVLQMWLLVALVIGAALGAIGLVLGRAALRQAGTDLARARQVLDEDAGRRRSLYQAQAAIMAEEPRLKAVVVTEDINPETVLDVAGELRRELRSDRFVIFDGEGRVVVDVGRPAARGLDLAADPLVARALGAGEANAVWVEAGRAWEMSAHRLAFGDSIIGVVAVGYAVDDRMVTGFERETATQAVVLLDGRSVASTLAKQTPVTLGALAETPTELDVVGAPFLALAAPYPDRGGADLRVVLLRPLADALAAKRAVFGVVAAIAAAGLLVVLILARALARRLSQPLDHLVAFTRKIAEGDLQARVADAPAVAEIAALAGSMNLMAQKLDESRSRLILADRMASVGTLASGVAHEINNPLTWVLGNLDFLAGELPSLVGSLPAERATELEELVEQTRDGAERVRRIVKDLKAFSRADEEVLGPVDVTRVLELAVNMTKAELKHRARLTRDYADTRMVLANESRLGQVFVNLLVNAAQAITEGKVDENEVRLSTRADGDRVIVEVRDSGGGISAEIRARIFDPFFTTKAIGVGTGLGLSICHGIVTAVGGAIEVDSEVGKGTTFRVSLPAAAVSAPLRPVAPARVRHKSGARGRILVVDDEPGVAAMFERELGVEHDVVVVSSGRQALDRLDAVGDVDFDVIVCDLMMPEVTGMDVHAALLARAPHLVERMVFVTGGAFTRNGREFLDQVPNPRFEKPVDMVGLQSLIRARVEARAA